MTDDLVKRLRNRIEALEDALQRERQVMGVMLQNITMRDQFAMAALTGLLANPVCIGWSQCAEDCYQMADKMLEAREAK